MWRHCGLVFLVGVGAACGSEPDYSTNFTGLWVGQETFTLTDSRSGQQATSQGQAAWTLLGNGRDSLVLSQFCDLNPNAGPHVTPTSATEFSVQPYACTLFVNSCPENVSLASGTGVLASPTLTITLLGTIHAIGSTTCPSGSANFDISFAARRANL
jgi:hypothetical protein